LALGYSFKIPSPAIWDQESVGLSNPSKLQISRAFVSIFFCFSLQTCRFSLLLISSKDNCIIYILLNKKFDPKSFFCFIS